jgi:hypothetical protein
MKTTIFAFVVALSATSLVSCQKESLPVKPDGNTAQLTTASKPPVRAAQVKSGIKSVQVQPRENYTVSNSIDMGNGCAASVVPLIAGQHINAGTVTVTNDDEFIYVTYNAENGYVMTQTHLYVGNCEAIPVTNTGNPSPGQFPYKTNHDYAASFTYQIPISAMGGENCGCISAHAALVKFGPSGENIIDTQTGWGGGSLINSDGGNWGMKFEYCTCYGGA